VTLPITCRAVVARTHEVSVAPGNQQVPGQQAAGYQLQALLLRVGIYREQWENAARHGNRVIKRDEVNQAAVCDVLAQYLYDNGHPDTDTRLARQLKDKVSRALRGKGLGPETLELFAEAFSLSPHDRQRLYSVYDGHIELIEIIGQLVPPPPDSGIRPPDHRTALLFEHHLVGRHGLPVNHHTQQTIYSAVDGLASYQYGIDTAEADVRVKRGGTAGEIYPIGNGYYGIDIKFPRPLGFRDIHYLDYWTNFRYSAAAPPPPEFRRGTHQRVEHLDMRVEFHRDKLPRRIWWAEWSDYLDVNRNIVQRQQVELDDEHSVHRYLDAIEHAVVGFYWEW
jgi:hypothetical protein